MAQRRVQACGPGPTGFPLIRMWPRRRRGGIAVTPIGLLSGPTGVPGAFLRDAAAACLAGSSCLIQCVQCVRASRSPGRIPVSARRATLSRCGAKSKRRRPRLCKRQGACLHDRVFK